PLKERQLQDTIAINRAHACNHRFGIEKGAADAGRPRQLSKAEKKIKRRQQIRSVPQNTKADEALL
ncbi:MAG: hypothetical protein AAFN59_07060, partial [Pseudomonadota bacterium]